jgi:DNA-binding XRE family transcriptional regulator
MPKPPTPGPASDDPGDADTPASISSALDPSTRAVLARNLRAARRAKGLSQEDLALASGVARPDISDIERGDPGINPTLDRLEKLAAALDTVPGALLSD